MALCGIEVEPGKPYIFGYEAERISKLHISQATLGDYSWHTGIRSVLMCQVGGKKPICLCSLMPLKFENCALNLELDVDEEVTFSVIGTRSVHLSGFYYGYN